MLNGIPGGRSGVANKFKPRGRERVLCVLVQSEMEGWNDEAWYMSEVAPEICPTFLRLYLLDGQRLFAKLTYKPIQVSQLWAFV